MMESKPRTDDGETGIRIRQRQDIAFLPREIFEALPALQCPRLFEHCRSQIDAGEMPRYAGKRASENSRSAYAVEYRVVRAGLCHFHDPVERVFIANRRGSRERDRLTRELIENMFFVFRPHALILQFFKW